MDKLLAVSKKSLDKVEIALHFHLYSCMKCGSNCDRGKQLRMAVRDLKRRVVCYGGKV